MARPDLSHLAKTRGMQRGDCYAGRLYFELKKKGFRGVENGVGGSRGLEKKMGH